MRTSWLAPLNWIASPLRVVTTAPGPDVEPYHDRQVAVLQPKDWRAWIELSAPEGDLLKPLSEGALAVEMVRPASA